MEEENKNLYVFGYGVALLAGYYLAFQVIASKIDHSVVRVIFFLIGFALVMFLTVLSCRWRPILNGWLFIPLFLGGYYYIKVFNINWTFGVGIVIGTLMLSFTILKINFIKPVYQWWMSLARLLSKIVTTVILFFIYFTIITPMGLLYRFLKKDVLDQEWHNKKDTYWVKTTSSFQPSCYERQY